MNVININISIKQARIRLKTLFSSQLRLNMLSGTLSTVLGAFVSIVSYPLYLHYLGYDHYGIWLLLSTMVIFAQMGLLGIGPAVTKLVAEEYEKKNEKAIQEYIITSFYILTVVGGVLLTSCVLFDQKIVRLMGLNDENAILASNLLPYMAIFSTGVLAYQILNSVLAGVGRIDLANYSQTALQVIPLFVSIPLLASGKGLGSLILANIFAYITVFSYNFSRINKIVSVSILAINSFSCQRFKRMIVFGGNVFLGSTLNMLVLPITKVVITRSIGVEGVTIFELTYRVSMQVRSLFEVAFRALMPEISKLSTEANEASMIKIKSIISKSYASLLIVSIPLYLFIFIFSEIIFKIWLGENYLTLIPGSFQALLIASYISLLGVIPYYTYMGLGRIRKILIHHIVCATGTLLSLTIAVNFLPSFNNILVAWCFVPGAAIGTGYLFIGISKIFPQNIHDNR